MKKDIQFRLTTEEKSAIEHRSGLLEMSPNEFVRCCATRYKREKLIPYNGDIKRGTDAKMTLDKFPYNDISGDLLRRVVIAQLDDFDMNPPPLPEPLPESVFDEAFKCALPVI
ncbi:MAG: hypothetical protein GY750_05125 [Lentisphaerae bacterium]|nr:hypothetical protein [Lentisphaerota bacterium]MCP4100795.1 hypothetical protein [Lentisphaerota bacterium]